MASLTTEVPQDLTSVQWRSVEWVTAFGALTPLTVLDYFAQSPFYDPTSNNAVLRMQTQYSVAAGTPFDQTEELRRFVGIEFAVTYSEPPDLFIIEKRDRKSPTETHPIAAYYVLHNSVYQAPDLYTIISNRLLSSLFYMQSSLSAAREKKTGFHPRTGGNRYKVIKEQQGQLEGIEGVAVSGDAIIKTTSGNEDKIVSGGDGKADVDVDGSIEKTDSMPVVAKDGGVVKSKAAKTGFNTDFLLARALQTTVQEINSSKGST